MKSAMHEALKKHMAKAKMSGPEESPKEEASESPKKEREEDLGDSAPSAGGQLGHQPAQAHSMNGEIGPEHMDLLMQILNQAGHSGSGAMSLDSTSAAHAKEKMASIMKHKHQV